MKIDEREFVTSFNTTTEYLYLDETPQGLVICMGSHYVLGLMQDLLKCDDDGEYEDIPEKIGEHWIYGVEDDCLLTDEFIIDEEAPSILLEAANMFNEATVTKWLEDNEWSVDSVAEIKREFEEYQKR